MEERVVMTWHFSLLYILMVCLIGLVLWRLEQISERLRVIMAILQYWHRKNTEDVP